jgi:hypothetical protein
MAEVSTSQFFGDEFAFVDGIVRLKVGDLGLNPTLYQRISDGDATATLYAIHQLIYQRWLATPAADRPTLMGVTKANVQGTGIDQGRQSYTTFFNLAYPPTNVDIARP